MSQILYEAAASPMKVDILGIYEWPIWEKEVSTFDWTYDEEETCYFLDGEVLITPHDEQEPVLLKRGYLVTFPQGMSCTWEIRKPVRKHFKIGD